MNPLLYKNGCEGHCSTRLGSPRGQLTSTQSCRIDGRVNGHIKRNLPRRISSDERIVPGGGLLYIRRGPPPRRKSSHSRRPSPKRRPPATSSCHCAFWASDCWTTLSPLNFRLRSTCCSCVSRPCGGVPTLTRHIKTGDPLV